MFFGLSPISCQEASLIAPRVLAHLGDAVFHLYERERETLLAHDVKSMHEKLAVRSSAEFQAELLGKIEDTLEEDEKDIVRRARNVKATGHKDRQNSVRRATAFEALLGYLYLTKPERLLVVLSQTN